MSRRPFAESQTTRRLLATIPIWVLRFVVASKSVGVFILLLLILDLLLAVLSYRAIVPEARLDPTFGAEGEPRTFLFIPLVLASALFVVDLAKLIRSSVG